MKPEQLIELVTDAVTDALRAALPAIVDKQIQAALIPLRDSLRRDVEVARAEGDVDIDAAERRVGEQVKTLRADVAEQHRAGGENLLHACEQRIAAALASVRDELVRALASATDAGDGGRDALARDFDLALQKIRGDFIEQQDKFAEGWHRVCDQKIGEAISEAVAALPLAPGPAGPPGAPGRDGRDATFTAPVHWKSDRVFARGSVVQHRGGLWFANVDSDEEPGAASSGYSLIVDGCEPHAVRTDDTTGELALVYRYASGVERALPLGFRPFRHAGIYDGGALYLQNDLVTSDGSVWLARARSMGLKPGSDDGRRAWQLVVKRGKDGRDGVQGATGPQGEPGPPGAPAPAPRTAKRNGVTP